MAPGWPRSVMNGSRNNARNCCLPSSGGFYGQHVSSMSILRNCPSLADVDALIFEEDRRWITRALHVLPPWKRDEKLELASNSSITLMPVELTMTASRARSHSLSLSYILCISPRATSSHYPLTEYTSMTGSLSIAKTVDAGSVGLNAPMNRVNDGHRFYGHAANGSGFGGSTPSNGNSSPIWSIFSSD